MARTDKAACDLADAEDGAGNGAGTFAYAAAVITGADDPSAIAGLARNDADVMPPNHYGTDLRPAGPAPAAPIPGQIEFRPATLLGAHPPPAPLPGPSSGAVLSPALPCAVPAARLGGL